MENTEKVHIVLCPPCGENVGLPTKRGLLNKEYFINNLPSVLRTTSPTGGEVNHSFTQTVVYKNCHSRGMLSGIYTLAKEQGEDPRQKPSGMTLNKITVRGFTLIELLVVVLIIGILAAVAVPQYQKAVTKSKLAEIDATIGTFKKAIDVWLLANGYPEHWTYFTGDGSATTEHYSSLDIDLAGAKDVIGNFSELGRWQLICSSSYCMIYLQTFYNADKTRGNMWLHQATISFKQYANEYNKQWVLSELPTNANDRKLICQWWRTNQGTEAMEDSVKTKCAAVGIE